VNDQGSVKPLALGYQVSRLDSPAAELVNGRRVVAAFAEREGFALAGVFVELDVNRPLSSFAALIMNARECGAEAVVVPAAEDLGRLPRVRQLLRERLEREAGVRVLIAQPVHGTAPVASADGADQAPGVRG
jgi:hypothetical protein